MVGENLFDLTQEYKLQYLRTYFYHQYLKCMFISI